MKRDANSIIALLATAMFATNAFACQPMEAIQLAPAAIVKHKRAERS